MLVQASATTCKMAVSFRRSGSRDKGDTHLNYLVIMSRQKLDSCWNVVTVKEVSELANAFFPELPLNPDRHATRFRSDTRP